MKDNKDLLQAITNAIVIATCIFIIVISAYYLPKILENQNTIIELMKEINNTKFSLKF